MRTHAVNGKSIEELAQTACSVWAVVHDHSVPEWDPGNAMGAAWCDVASRAIDIVDMPADEQAVREVSARKFAETLHHVYDESLMGSQKWEDLDVREQLCWEAVARHLANWIDSDGTVDLSATEGRWRQWVEDKSMVPV